MEVCSERIYVRGGVKPTEYDIKDNGKVKSDKEWKKDECNDLGQKLVWYRFIFSNSGSEKWTAHHP
jgi:hypothetical protein